MKFWENLSARDQRTLKWGLVAAIVLIVIRFIWWPLLSRVDRLQEDIANEAALITWMKPMVETIKANAGKVKPLDHQAPKLSLIERSFEQAGLGSYVKSLSQNANNQIVLQAKAVPFGALAQCLETIAQTQGMVPLSLTATREKTGIVDVEIVF
ncbi:MAG: type II secretion system protein GspM [Gammaproteobacteria bacterium]